MSVPRRPWQPREAVARGSRLLAISKGAGIATLVLLVVTGASVAGIVSSNQHRGVTPAAAAAVPSSSSSATLDPGTSTVSAGTTSAASATGSVSSSSAVVLAIVKPKSQGQPGIVPVPLAPHATAGPIPLLAWEAYHRAAATSGCNLPWYVLAGIGKIESNHGRYGGAQFDVTGTVHPSIFGPPTAYGRAMGPMQFIPPTWTAYAADGNGDDITNPQNIFDATKAAAHYLCKAGGPDLSGLAAQRRAVFAYNHLDSYVADVLAFAAAYQHSEPERVVHVVPIVYPKPAPKAVATTPSSASTSASAGRTSAAPTSRTHPSTGASTTSASTTSASTTNTSASGTSTSGSSASSAPPTTSTCPTTPTPSTSATRSSGPSLTSGSTSAMPTQTTAAPSGSTSSSSTPPTTCPPCSSATATPSTSASATPTACPTTTAPSTSSTNIAPTATPPTTPHITQR